MNLPLQWPRDKRCVAVISILQEATSSNVCSLKQASWSRITRLPTTTGSTCSWPRAWHQYARVTSPLPIPTEKLAQACMIRIALLVESMTLTHLTHSQLAVAAKAKTVLNQLTFSNPRLHVALGKFWNQNWISSLGLKPESLKWWVLRKTNVMINAKLGPLRTGSRKRSLKIYAAVLKLTHKMAWPLWTVNL